MDILWTCLVTTFLCTYTILCLNCPSSDDGFWRTQARKLLWMGVAISGPEFVLTAAAGQLAAARDSVRSFHAIGHTTWTYRHGFFANMGGFVLVCSDCSPFRVNSKHLHWLITRGYIQCPEVSDQELWDKSKQDTVAKLITCFQAAYLIVQCIGRAIQGLAMTTLELSTMAIVVCSIMTSICWIAKPQDASYPVRIHMETTMAKVLCDAGPIASRPYRQTPLDFVDDLTPSWALNIQTFMRMPVGPFKRPIPRIGDSRLPWLSWAESSLLCLGTMIYASIHMSGWNFTFPSRVEQTLWKVSSLILLLTTVVFWIVESLAMWYRYGGGDVILARLYSAGRSKEVVSAPEEARRPQDNAGPSTGLVKPKGSSSGGMGPPEYAEETPFEPRELPLVWEFWTIFPIAVVYAAARAYILVEALLGLRSLPVSAYLAVDWARFIPHI